jgi:hypothetical protein
MSRFDGRVVLITGGARGHSDAARYITGAVLDVSGGKSGSWTA